jgi:hypothetical protein
MFGMRTRVLCAGTCIALLALGATGAPAAKRRPTKPVTPLPRVTLISDSVASSISFDTGAKAILAKGVNLFLYPGEGRTLTGPADPGAFSPTGLQLISSLGQKLGPTVIMSIGDNDVCCDYGTAISAAISELEAAGVKHILWSTLHVSPDHTSYALFNSALASAAASHADVTVLDWNAYSTPHPEWFQGDGVHLLGAGPRALAAFLHAGLVKAGVIRGS